MNIGSEGKPPLLLASAILLALLALGAWQLGGAPAAPVSSAVQESTSSQYTGPGSCASTSCHGSVKPRDETRVLQNEYSIWVVRDKHSKAYSILAGPVGVRMARILGLGDPQRAPRCLACHALDVPAAERARTFDLNEGVSCESCHGPSSQWLGRHTTKEWQSLSGAEKARSGMYDTDDVVRRSEKCLTCHLGTPEKFVDHELIAAGHPDLYFELDSFSAVMPRHWKQPLEKDPWLGVREWGTGQAVQLRASLERLADRARGKVWPEYAELQCFACHHNLTRAEDSWRQERGYPGRRPGNPPWNASRYAVFRELVRQMDGESAGKLDAEMTRLWETMSRLNPERDAVVTLAGNAAGIVAPLAARLNTQTYDAPSTLRLLQRICAQADSISGQGERAAEQAAMALDTLYIAYSRSAKAANAEEVRAAINALFQQLENPSNYNPTRFAAGMRKVGSLLR